MVEALIHVPAWRIQNGWRVFSGK